MYRRKQQGRTAARMPHLLDEWFIVLQRHAVGSQQQVGIAVDLQLQQVIGFSSKSGSGLAVQSQQSISNAIKPDAAEN